MLDHSTTLRVEIAFKTVAEKNKFINMFLGLDESKIFCFSPVPVEKVNIPVGMFPVISSMEYGEHEEKDLKPEFSSIKKDYIEPMLFEIFYPQDGEWQDTMHPSNDPFSETTTRYLVSLIVRKGDLVRYLKCLAQIKGKAPLDSATYFEEMKAIFMTYNLISESLDESDSFHIHLN